VREPALRQRGRHKGRVCVRVCVCARGEAAAVQLLPPFHPFRLHASPFSCVSFPTRMKPQPLTPPPPSPLPRSPGRAIWRKQAPPPCPAARASRRAAGGAAAAAAPTTAPPPAGCRAPCRGRSAA